MNETTTAKIKSYFNFSSGFLLAIVANILWGTSFLASKYTLQAWGPFTSVALRFGIATVCLLVILKALKKKIEAGNYPAVDRIESSLIELVKEKLTEPEIIRFAVKQYNHILQTNNSASPDRLKSISAELDKVETELTNLIQVIISGGASDTVNVAIREREQRKMRLKSESHALKKTQGKTAQITEKGILERLETVNQAILENPLLCYPILRMLFP
jgi:hypothetical protein